ncbi:MAG: HNH endonuclease [Actinomycetota bacterium]|nr:HNH endonuclease [Actinomycetota bacterium]
MEIDPKAPVPEPPLTLAEGAGLLTELSDALNRMEQATAQAVDLVGRLQRAGVVEHLEGLPLELFLALQHRLTSADRRMLLEGARVLDRLPHTRRLFSEQKLSWGQVRGIVTRLRRLPVEDLAEIDARVEASLERIDGYSPEELVWAVERAADELDGARKLQRREQRRVAANFLAVQPCLDGAISLYGELDPVAGSTVLNALDAACDRPTAEPKEPGEPSSRAKQRAQGLQRICSDWLGGGRGRPARPSLVVHVDLSEVTTTAAGLVELAAPGGLPTVTAATVERLAKDADLRAVLFNGARPLAVSAKTRAAQIPAEIRLAVGARDRGCRFPGSTTPLRWADCHHIVPREDDGDHHPENLAYYARRWHLLVHRQGWEQHLDAHTGELVITRNGRTWRSLPRGTPLGRPSPPPPGKPPQPHRHDQQ